MFTPSSQQESAMPTIPNAHQLRHTERLGKIRFAIADLIKFPEGRHFDNFFYSFRDYRGQKRWVVGYEWSRLYSHYASGKVYEHVCGYGEDFDAAVADAVRRLTKSAA